MLRTWWVKQKRREVDLDQRGRDGLEHQRRRVRLAWFDFELGAWGLGLLGTWAAWVGGVDRRCERNGFTVWVDGVGQLRTWGLG